MIQSEMTVGFSRDSQCRYRRRYTEELNNESLKHE